MRLFPKVDGAVDRYERAAWMTVPFDLSWLTGGEVISFTAYIDRARSFVGYIEQDLAKIIRICRSRTFKVER